MGHPGARRAGLHHGPQPGVQEATRQHWQQDARLALTAVNRVDAISMAFPLRYTLAIGGEMLRPSMIQGASTLLRCRIG